MKKAIKTLPATLMLAALLSSNTVGAYCPAGITITKPDSIYTDHGNGTVTDNQTGLMWMQCSQGLSGSGCSTGKATTMNWKQALEAVQTANSGAGTLGYSDWRLPDKNELASLMESACSSPAINTVFFPNTVEEAYWSSSPDANYQNQAWTVYFNDGGVYGYAKNSSLPVRLVRGGQ